jgi:hypothetical protein
LFNRYPEALADSRSVTRVRQLREAYEELRLRFAIQTEELEEYKKRISVPEALIKSAFCSVPKENASTEDQLEVVMSLIEVWARSHIDKLKKGVDKVLE